MENREGNEVFQQFKEQSKQFEQKFVPPTPQGPLEFDVPVECVPLPSGGLIYPQGHPLHAKDDVEIIGMSARHEDVLTSRALIKKGTVIDTLLKMSLVDKTIQVDDMISGDRMAILLAIRITGYGPELTADITCGNCDNKFKHTFMLSDFPINRIKDKPVEEFTNKFSFHLPRWNKDVTFRYLTGRDEQDLNVAGERIKKHSDVENLVTTRLAQSILSIDNVTDRNKIANAVRNMPASDSLALRNYMTDNEPRVDMISDVSCPNCDWEGEADMPADVSFFWPQRRR